MTKHTQHVFAIRDQSEPHGILRALNFSLARPRKMRKAQLGSSHKYTERLEKPGAENINRNVTEHHNGTAATLRSGI
jgi:hypothetical protein